MNLNMSCANWWQFCLSRNVYLYLVAVFVFVFGQICAIIFVFAFETPNKNLFVFDKTYLTPALVSSSERYPLWVRFHLLISAPMTKNTRCNGTVSQIPQCTYPLSTIHHSEQKCAHFCSEWCVVGYGIGALCGLWYWSIYFILVRWCYMLS